MDKVLIEGAKYWKDRGIPIGVEMEHNEHPECHGVASVTTEGKAIVAMRPGDWWTVSGKPDNWHRREK